MKSVLNKLKWQENCKQKSGIREAKARGNDLPWLSHPSVKKYDKVRGTAGACTEVSNIAPWTLRERCLKPRLFGGLCHQICRSNKKAMWWIQMPRMLKHFPASTESILDAILGQSLWCAKCDILSALWLHLLPRLLTGRIVITTWRTASKGGNQCCCWCRAAQRNTLATCLERL